MFVLADIEWVIDRNENEYPTQLAAVRVDENWNETDSFSSFIRPKDGETPYISHMAYTGGTAEDFQNADSLSDVFSAFENWLSEEDIIVWWHSESDELFRKLFRFTFKRNDAHNSVCVNKYVYAFLAGQEHSRGNMYKIAAARGIEATLSKQHFSTNDVNVMRELMKSIEYPQQDLLKPLPVTEKEESQNSIAINNNLPYQYDPLTNNIHIRECLQLAGRDIKTKGYWSLKKILGKGYKPCDCCKTEFNKLFRERNADIISRTRYTYVYSPNSDVFHKPNCKTILNAKKILGTEHYCTVIGSGRKPCKICNPQPQDELKKHISRTSKKASRKIKQNEKFCNNEERKAVKRQLAAIKERDSKLKKTNLSETEKNDIYTLTQPGYAFWVGRGYRNFHLRTCVKLQGISNLKGFGTYNDAVRAGYTPCRHCKPTSKHDVKYSIPITSRKRIGDTVEKLEEMCRTEGYKYIINEGRFCLETDVGKWRILLNTSPVKLEHINLVRTPNEKNYHEQPRLFLSLADTFSYIKRHDEELLKQKQKGMVYLKLIREG